MNRRLVPDWDGDTEVEIDVPEWCPIIEVTGTLIDRNELEKAVLKWMPHDPCGKEEFGERKGGGVGRWQSILT